MGAGGGKADLLAVGEGADAEWGLRLQLAQETALLALAGAATVVVIDERDVLCPLQQAVERIGIDGVLAFGGVETETGAQDVGDERRVGGPAGNDALAHGEHDEVTEVEVARLQQSHHLQSLVFLAVEGDAGRLNGLAEETAQGGGAHVEDALGDEPAELAERLVELERGFGVEGVEN